MQKQKGFTLIELLMVVLIIGILATIAVSAYQKAVLKSRFSSLMPLAKTIQNGNEAYYMLHGQYANQLNDLDVAVEQQASNMTIDINGQLGWAYVKATRSNLPNNYLMYQKHSKNYPGEIHCEAQTENSLANWLCEEALQGKKLHSSITPGYTTYALTGDGNGMTPQDQQHLTTFLEMAEALMRSIDAHIEENGYAGTPSLEDIDSNELTQTAHELNAFGSWKVSCHSQNKYCQISIMLHSPAGSATNVQLMKWQSRHDGQWTYWQGADPVLCQYWQKTYGHVNGSCPE